MEQFISDQQVGKITGIHKIIICEPVNALCKSIEALLARSGIPWDEYLALIKELTTRCLVKQWEVHNIIPTAGRAVIARWIVGDNTYNADDGANFGSLGTSAVAPVAGNTTLGTETYRKATSSGTSSSNVSYLSNFYTAIEVTGTFEEAGWHIAGTGAANSGQLLSRFLTGSITKTATETLTVQSTLTIS